MSGAQKKMSSYFSKPGKKCSTDEPTSKRSKQESGSKSDSVCEEPEKTLDETTSTTTVNIHTEIQTASIPLGEELGGTGTYEDRELPNDSDTEIPSTSTPESGKLSLLQHSALLTKGPLLPKGWKLDQKQYFQTKYPWLIVRGHTLGCRTCRQVNSLGAEKSRGMKLSKEWTECTVSSYGTNKDKQQRSLRKKIAEHFSTKAHVTASKILEQAKKDTLLKVTSRAQAGKIATTARIFRTAYKEAKRNRPAYGFESEIDCQQLNGLDMGRILHSNVACSSIQQHISSEMKRKTFAKIVDSSTKVILLLDEATALNKKSALIVYLRTQLQDMESPANISVDLIELSDVSAEGIVNSLLSSLQKDPIKISEDFLTKCLVSVACDGASVMFGRNSGVVKRLQERISPNIVAWHCSAHRLELAVNDVMKGATNHFKALLDKLYSLFSTSVKNRLQLKECADALDIQLCKIGRVLDTRWVTSSYRTVEAVWNAYPALYKHFTLASSDGSRDGTTRNMYTGLCRRLSSVQFVGNLGIIFDALQELSELSLDLQKRDYTIIDAHRAICRQISVFEAMAERRGKHSSQCQKAIEENSFQGVTLHEGKACDKKIEHGQFFRSLAENLRSRLLSTGGSAAADNKVAYEKLISELKVLYKQYWPDELTPTYGEREIESLCEIFDIGDTRQTIRAYREHRETGGKEANRHYKELLTAVNTIAISTAECERGFSQMNLVCTSARASLHTDTISSLLFINLVGPPLKKFNPIPYVNSWIAKGRRAADDPRSKERKEDMARSDLDILWAFMSE